MVHVLVNTNIKNNNNNVRFFVTCYYDACLG